MKMFSIQYSEALGGFYQSSIFVIAANKEQAKEKIKIEAIRLMEISDHKYDKFEYIGMGDLTKYTWNDYEHEEIDDKIKAFFILLEKDFESLVESRDCIFVYNS